jgi:hypothetical protein
MRASLADDGNNHTLICLCCEIQEKCPYTFDAFSTIPSKMAGNPRTQAVQFWFHGGSDS